MTAKQDVSMARIYSSRSIVNGGLKEVFKETQLIKDLLDVMSRFDFSAQDCLLVAKIMPNASHFGTFEDWNSQGSRINKGEKGITFLDYDKGEKRVWFDISQTNSKKELIPKKDNKTPREKLRSLLANNKFRIIAISNNEYTKGKPAYFELENKFILTDCAVDFQTLYPSLTAEIAHSYLWLELRDKYNYSSYDATAKMVSYIICRKNGIEPNGIQITDELCQLTPEQTKVVLDNVRLVSDKIQENIEFYYQNGRDKFERPKPQNKNVVVIENVADPSELLHPKKAKKSVKKLISEKKKLLGIDKEKYQPQQFKDNLNKGGKI